MNRKKILTSGVAVASALAILFGGTFAWQSISQTALNEVSASVNPGGRLHDDFNAITYDTEGNRIYDTMTYNKDVYVENFTALAANGVQVFARVRLDEYMELGEGAGLLDENGFRAANNFAASLVNNASLSDKSSWHTYQWGDTTSPFRQYWDLEFGGKTVYMPTFNKNKDSLEADINGSFDAGFLDYVQYELGDQSGEMDGQLYAVCDADAAPIGEKEVDELAKAKLPVSKVIEQGAAAFDGVLTDWEDHVEVWQESHTAAETIDGTIMSMGDYLDRLYDADDAFDGKGNFWVYDTDGWAYWANPIDPESATGLLLDGISRTDAIINQDWYYAINVVAQFVTFDDIGRGDATGFYDLTEGSAPTDDALALLQAIGVRVGTEVSTEDELYAALNDTSCTDVILTGDIQLTEPLAVSYGTHKLNLNSHTISAANDLWDDSQVPGSPEGTNRRDWSLISVRNKASLTISGKGTLQARANDSYCVDVQDGSSLTINGGDYHGNISAVYVHQGSAVINDGAFYLQQLSPMSDYSYKYMLNCYDENYANGSACITVNGGIFYGVRLTYTSDDFDWTEGFDPALPCESDDNAYLGENSISMRTFDIDMEAIDNMGGMGAFIESGLEMPKIRLVIVMQLDPHSAEAAAATEATV